MICRHSLLRRKIAENRALLRVFTPHCCCSGPFATVETYQSTSVSTETEFFSTLLEGIRAKVRGERPITPKDPFLLRDVATVLIDCGMRPEECCRLEWASVRNGGIEIQHGKTDAARRRIPLSKRAEIILDVRRQAVAGPWVFPAATRSGHIEPCSLKRQHAAACKQSKVEPFPLYSLRHTCLTRWAPNMDPWTLSYLAGHRDMAITRRYVHPQEQTVREAMERAQAGHMEKTLSGHKIGHTAEPVVSETGAGKTAIN
jgi:integrase